MKKILMVVLLLAGAVAFTTAQAWAGNAAMLSDKGLDAVYGGSGDITQSQTSSPFAVQVAATCENCDHALRVRDMSQEHASAVNLLNTVASNNAQQVNVTSGSGHGFSGTAIQSNVAYSATISLGGFLGLRDGTLR